MSLLYRLKQIIIVSGDMACYILAFFISLTVRNWQIPSWSTIEIQSNLFLSIFVIWLVINYINGLYDLDRITDKKNLYYQTIITAGISLFIGISFFYLIPSRNITPKTILILNIIFGYLLCTGWRILAAKLINIKKFNINVIMVGDNPEARELINIIQNSPGKGYRIMAIIDPNNDIKSTDYPDLEIYHGFNTIRPAITTKKANLVVIAPHLAQNPTAMRELYELLFWDVEIMDLPSFYELITGRVTPAVFSEGWFLEHLKQNKRPIYQKIKSIIDYFAGIIMAVIFISLLLFIALAIKISSKGPIFFKQKRVGKGGKIFNIYKFRSMFALSPDGSAETKGYEFAQKKDVRITLVGKFLRKTRLDELPQFINLLKGDLALIGPRPERPEIVDKLKEQMSYYPLRHTVKPGITGWAVIHQNYTSDLESSLQKLQYDLYYIKNRSILLDLSIVLRTINVVMRMAGQ